MKHNTIIRPSIYLNNISYRSIRTFISAIILWFIIVMCVNFLLNTFFLNIHFLIDFKFDWAHLRLIPAEDCGYLFIHGFISSLTTGVAVISVFLFQKKKLYQARMINAFRTS